MTANGRHRIGKRLAARALAAVVLGALLVGGPARAGTLPTGAPLADAGWRTVDFPGIPATRFVGRGDEGIELIAERSSGLLVREIAPGDAAGGALSWRWKVDAAPPPADLAARGADDRPLALHLFFPAPDADRGLFGALADALTGAATGLPEGRVITYVWGGRGMRGDRVASPYLGPDGVMVILRPGDAPTGAWFTETVDFVADYAGIFGEPAPAPVYLALSADSDDLAGLARGTVRDLRFVMP